MIRTNVIIRGGYGYGYPFGYYGYPLFYDQWGPYPYAYPPLGYYGRMDELTAAIKLEVKPREAQVFVDGYMAGIVDDFDGVFQRLRLRPGGHDIVIFLEGYRTIHQSLYLNRGADQKVRYIMEPLPAGERSEPPPQPRPMGPGDGMQGPGPDDRRPASPAPRPQAQGPRPPAGPPNGPPPGDSRSSFGSLAIRVQPGDAEILIDGERWAAPAGQDRIVIELTEGRHHVEIRKTGFNQYTEDVLIRRGATLPLNVSLLRGGGQ